VLCGKLSLHQTEHACYTWCKGNHANKTYDVSWRPTGSERRNLHVTHCMLCKKKR
jgi:hypothetical protein